jgi:hypothetical protein
MQLTDVSRLVDGLDGTSERLVDGMLTWRCRGRLVARQLDQTRVVIRSSFDARDLLVRSFPGTFSVPTRFAKHMMIAADLQLGDDDAIEEAIVTAWRMQSEPR